jgi:hypothetical protein
MSSATKTHGVVSVFCFIFLFVSAGCYFSEPNTFDIRSLNIYIPLLVDYGIACLLFFMLVTCLSSMKKKSVNAILVCVYVILLVHLTKTIVEIVVSCIHDPTLPSPTKQLVIVVYGVILATQTALLFFLQIYILCVCCASMKSVYFILQVLVMIFSLAPSCYLFSEILGVIDFDTENTPMVVLTIVLASICFVTSTCSFFCLEQEKVGGVENDQNLVFLRVAISVHLLLIVVIGGVFYMLKRIIDGVMHAVTPCIK